MFYSLDYNPFVTVIIYFESQIGVDLIDASPYKLAPVSF